MVINHDISEANNLQKLFSQYGDSCNKISIKIRQAMQWLILKSYQIKLSFEFDFERIKGSPPPNGLKLSPMCMSRRWRGDTAPLPSAS